MKELFPHQQTDDETSFGKKSSVGLVTARPSFLMENNDEEDGYSPTTPVPNTSRCYSSSVYLPSDRADFVSSHQQPHDDYSVRSTPWTCYNRSTTGGSATTTQRGAQYTLIANVPYDTVRQDLVVEFRKYGRVELAMVVCDEASRHPHKEWTSTAGYAFVRFSQRSEAAAAIQAASLGLITIRGTRVRADWARKDSYAKRGRVSPTQGAPLLGPFGVPDGIEQLRHYSIEQQRAAAAAATAGSTPKNELSRFFPQVSDRSPSTTASETTGQLEVLHALQEAFTNMMVEQNPPLEGSEAGGLQTAPTTPELKAYDDNLKPALPPCCLSSSHAIEMAAASSPSTTHIDFLPQCFTPTTTSPPPTNAGLDDVLSPCSRGLLAQALSDVVTFDYLNTATNITAVQTTPCNQTSSSSSSSSGRRRQRQRQQERQRQQQQQQQQQTTTTTPSPNNNGNSTTPTTNTTPPPPLLSSGTNGSAALKRTDVFPTSPSNMDKSVTTTTTTPTPLLPTLGLRASHRHDLLLEEC